LDKKSSRGLIADKLTRNVALGVSLLRLEFSLYSQWSVIKNTVCVTAPSLLTQNNARLMTQQWVDFWSPFIDLINRKSANFQETFKSNATKFSNLKCFAAFLKELNGSLVGEHWKKTPRQVVLVTH